MADYPPHTCERLAKSQDAGDGPGCPFAGVAGVASPPSSGSNARGREQGRTGGGGGGGGGGSGGRDGGGARYSRVALELRAELAGKEIDPLIRSSLSL